MQSTTIKQQHNEVLLDAQICFVKLLRQTIGLQYRNIMYLACICIMPCNTYLLGETNTCVEQKTSRYNLDCTVCSCRHSKTQYLVAACTVYGDSTVCSCRHSKSSASVRSMYCVQRPYCVQLQAQKDTASGSRMYCVWKSHCVQLQTPKDTVSDNRMYCVWRPYCVQLQAQQVTSLVQKHGLCVETLLCVAVGTASDQLGLEARTVCGDPTVCSCRHNRQSELVRSMYCVWQFGIMLKNDKAVPNHSELNQLGEFLRFTFDSPCMV